MLPVPNSGRNLERMTVNRKIGKWIWRLYKPYKEDMASFLKEFIYFKHCYYEDSTKYNDHTVSTDFPGVNYVTV